VQPLLQWKKISIKYFECVSVALSFQHAIHMRHIVICGLSYYTIFSKLSRKWNYFFVGGGG